MKGILIILGVCFWCQITSAQPIVKTEHGLIEGVINGNVIEFKGIPFAASPVGDLRWKAPIPPDSWTQVLETKSFSPKCPQKHFAQGDTTATYEGDEDCLYLNVWTPDTNANLPVMVFIHGGGNQQGSASETAFGVKYYDGKNMSERGNVVLVTIQYRLGPLGFLVHPGLEEENGDNVSGNYAVLDQIFALEWVQNNIEIFGGDISKVMIFGESAGGVNVGNLMTTDRAEGLFSRACIQSGGPNLIPYQEAKDTGISFVEEFVNSGTNQEKIEMMRGLSAESLLASIESPLNGGIVQSSWKPTLDNFIFEDYPINVIQSGDYNQVPLIVGSNANESSLSSPAVVLPFMVNVLVNTTIPPAFQDALYQLYPIGSTNDSARMAYIDILTDVQFTAPARRIAQCVSNNQLEPVFRYFFEHNHAGFFGNYGAYHGIELFYLFNVWEPPNIPFGSFHTTDDELVSEAMLQYWVNFANTGNPNNGDLANWPPYEADKDCYLTFESPIVDDNCGLRTAKSDFWDDLVGFSGCTSVSTISPMDADSEVILLRPNPVKDQLFLDPSLFKHYSTVSIYNSQNQFVSLHKNETVLQVSHLPPGAYNLIIKNVKTSKCLRFIKL